MNGQNPTSVDLSGSNAGAKGDLRDLSAHEQKIIDYALHGVGAAMNASLSARTEEIVVRTRTALASEVDRQFTTYSNLTTSRRVMMAIAGVAAFGLGFLVKGWIVGSGSDDDDMSNGVNE